MLGFFAALGHLLSRSVTSLVFGWMATSLLALGVGSLNYWIAPYIDAWLHGEKPVKPKRVTGSLIVGAGAWLILFGVSVIHTIYVDHVNLVSQNQVLRNQNSSAEQQVAKLNVKLRDACYRPDRHLTPEQENILYLALRDTAQGTPANLRTIYLGTVEGDKESQRFSELFLEPNFEKAGWKVVPIMRHIVKEPTDIQFPFFPGGGVDVSVTATLDLGTSEYRNELKYVLELLRALDVLKQTDMMSAQGLMDPHEPLRRAHGFIVWISPKKDSPKN